MVTPATTTTTADMASTINPKTTVIPARPPVIPARPPVIPARPPVIPARPPVIPGLTRNPFRSSPAKRTKWTPGQARGDE